jgi:hypothetical protein
MPLMQGKPAEYVPARQLRDGDIIPRPGKADMTPQRLGAVIVDGEQVRVQAKGQDKWYTFGADDPVLRRVSVPAGRSR